jgi:negative regulator of sigma E activity
MSTPDSELDKHLRTLFGGLDTRADFDARLMARLRAESHRDANEGAMRARQQERARYRRAVLELQSWRRSMLRVLTLDTLGIALLLVVAVVMAWPHFSRNVVEISRQYGPYIAMLLGVLIAAVPLLGMWAEQTRRPIRLL